MEVAPGVDVVHRRLLDRILTGFYPAGSRLPSCRALADDLGSNSSTVDRAIGRLAASGRVRTVPRRGTFVAETDAGVADPASVIRADLEEILLRARRLGISAAELTEMVASTLDRVEGMRRIAVVECNARDLRSLQHLLQSASGVEVATVLLSEIGTRVLDEEFDAVACPVFHLNDLADHVTSLDQVVELHLVASPRALRRLIDLRDQPELTVVAPSHRGVQWMTALVGQYFPGRIVGVDSSESTPDQLARLADAPVVVVNNAATVPTDVADAITHLIPIEWELDARFAPALRGRIDQAISARR